LKIAKKKNLLSFRSMETTSAVAFDGRSVADYGIPCSELIVRLPAAGREFGDVRKYSELKTPN